MKMMIILGDDKWMTVELTVNCNCYLLLCWQEGDDKNHHQKEREREMIKRREMMEKGWTGKGNIIRMKTEWIVNSKNNNESIES